MRRSLKKAVAFLAFLAMAFQIFVVSDATPASAAATSFEVDEWGYVNTIINPTPSVTIPGDLDAESVSLSLLDTGVESLTIENGYTSVSIYDGDKLEELVLPKSVDSVYISFAPNLKKITFGNSLSYLYIYSCGSLEELDVPASVTSLSVEFCENLKTMKLGKGLQEYSQWGCPKLKVTIPSTVSYIYCDDYSNMTISADNPYYELYEGSLYRDETLTVAANKPVLNVKPGTKAIGGWALCNAYAVTTINLPDSVEVLEWGAFSGATKVKKLKLSKNLVCIYSYAFDGIAADTIEIPSTVSYLDWDAFGGYNGSISLQGGYNSEITSYKGGIYSNDMTLCYYYPKNKETLNLPKGVISLASSSLNGCIFKELDIPEGIGEINLDLSECKKLKSINFPASAWWIDTYSLAYRTPRSLTKYTVAADNPYYSSSGGCLYSKDKEILHAVPYAKKDVKVVRGCVTISYYALVNDGYYDYKNDVYVPRDINLELPATLSSCDNFNAVKTVKVPCGTTAAGLVVNYNSWYWAPVSYEFTNTSKEILSMIEVGDDMQIKKGNKASVYYTWPTGLTMVSKLTAAYDGTNTVCKVSYSSKDKSIAKVNSKTGEITALKKGKTTITAKFEMPDGKTRKVKVKVTVK